jgi:hypothetical protein
MGEKKEEIKSPTRILECMPNITLSMTLRWGSTSRFWNVLEIPQEIILQGLLPIRFFSLNRIRPLCGLYKLLMQLRSVVLPDPFGPIRPKISPSLISIETELRATNP